MRACSTSATVLVLGVLMGVTACADGQPRQAPGTARMRPPGEFACNRNDLTNYVGVVIAYRREMSSTTLRIRTDADTTESVVLPHPGTDDPSALFRFGGKAFTAADWTRIERSKGVLRPATRAVAWVCTDGQVMVDWEAPKE